MYINNRLLTNGHEQASGSLKCFLSSENPLHNENHFTGPRARTLPPPPLEGVRSTGFQQRPHTSLWVNRNRHKIPQIGHSRVSLFARIPEGEFPHSDIQPVPFLAKPQGEVDPRHTQGKLSG